MQTAPRRIVMGCQDTIAKSEEPPIHGERDNEASVVDAWLIAEHFLSCSAFSFAKAPRIRRKKMQRRHLSFLSGHLSIRTPQQNTSSSRLDTNFCTVYLSITRFRGPLSINWSTVARLDLSSTRGLSALPSIFTLLHLHHGTNTLP